MRCPTLGELPSPPPGRTGWPWTEESKQLSGTMPDSSTRLRANGEPWPKVSIVTPSYNQGQFIEETVRSVLLQGYTNLEYIIIDGGSNDSSVDIIRKYEPWLAYWVSEPDEGQSQAINKGFKQTTGEILGWLNSDDYFLPGALWSIAEAHRRYPGAGAWFGACQRVDKSGKCLSVRWPKRVDCDGLADKTNNWVMQPACLFNACAWNACGPLDIDLRLAMDFDLMLKIAAEFEIRVVDSVLAAARIHSRAKTQVERGAMFAEIWVVQIQHGYQELALPEMAALLDDYIRTSRKLKRVGESTLWSLLRVYWQTRKGKVWNAIDRALTAYEEGWAVLRSCLSDPLWLSSQSVLSTLIRSLRLRIGNGNNSEGD